MNNKTKIIPLLLGVTILSFIVGAIVFAWREPGALPPGDNVPAPINVGTATQNKAGEIRATRFVDFDDSMNNFRWFVDPAASISALFAGNVGIGTATPGAGLDVNRGNDGILVRAATNEGGRIRIVNDLKTGATTRDWSLWNMTGPYGNGLSFWRYFADGTNQGPSVWFGDNGNVGIGTTTPAGRIDVVDSFWTTPGRLNIRPQNGVIEGGEIGLLGAGANPQFVIDNYTGRLRFNRTSPSGAEVMTILQNGNVGIGTASPGWLLHVAGTAAAHAFHTISDVAFKANVQPLHHGLREVLQLQPRSFNFNSETATSIGFVAQEIEKVIPEVVSGQEGKKGVSYANLTAVLTKAIQEQQKEIENLKARIEILENR